jgi:hypothetical protein
VHRLARRGANGDGAAVPHDDLVDVDIAGHVPASLADQSDERVGEAPATPDRRRDTGGENGQGKHHPKRAGRILRPNTEMQRPRRPD